MSEITRIPPPKYTLKRADFIYGEAFRRAVEYVVNQSMPGDVLEFGTLNGFTGRKLAEIMVELEHPGKLHLFDSFEGMPEATGIDLVSYEVRGGAWKPGTPRLRVPDADVLIRDELSVILPNRLSVVKGWFADTMQYLPDHAPSIVHIDCDMYESAVTVLKALADRMLVQQGMIIMFDDWNSGRASNQLGERAAFAQAFLGQEKWFSYGWSGQAFICHMMESSP